MAGQQWFDRLVAIVDTTVPQSQHAEPSLAVKMVDDVPMGSAPTDAAGRTRRAGAHMALIDKPEAVAFVGPRRDVRRS